MNTIRGIGRWWIPLVGIYLIIVGIGLLFNVGIPTVIVGVLALVAGILALFSS